MYKSNPPASVPVLIGSFLLITLLSSDPEPGMMWVTDRCYKTRCSSDVILSLTFTEVTDQGGRRDLKAVPFISYLSGLLKTQLLSDDLVAGVEIRCQEKGSCPAACHLCRQAGRETPSPTPVLLEVSRIVPLYSLVQDNVTKEVNEGCIWSSLWLF